MRKLAHGVVVKFSADFDKVIEAFKYVPEAFNVYSEVFSTKPRIAVFVGEQYYIRAGSSLLVTSIAIESGKETVVKVITGGGKAGLLDISDWGASRDYVWKIIQWLSQVLKLKPKLITEVDYLDISKAHLMRGHIEE
ncbi:MAG TPA: hypothetical protein ENF75_00355 [Acidilobales archaeon]|nr:hypothetical protein [Acidilobales archaeon]